MKALSLSGGQEQGEPLNPSPMKEFSLLGGQEQRRKLLISASKSLIPHLREGMEGRRAIGGGWWKGGDILNIFSREQDSLC